MLREIKSVHCTTLQGTNTGRVLRHCTTGKSGKINDFTLSEFRIRLQGGGMNVICWEVMQQFGPLPDMECASTLVSLKSLVV